MIAPLRETTKTRERPRSEGMRRARRWIVRTLLVEREAESDEPHETLRYYAAALWMVGIATAYVVHSALSRM